MSKKTITIVISALVLSLGLNLLFIGNKIGSSHMQHKKKWHASQGYMHKKDHQKGRMEHMRDGKRGAMSHKRKGGKAMPHKGKKGMHAGRQSNPIARLVQSLEPEKREEIKSVIKPQHERMREYSRNYSEARTRILALLKAEKLDMTALQTELEALNDLETNLRGNFYMMVLELSNSLPADARGKIIRLLDFKASPKGQVMKAKRQGERGKKKKSNN